MGLLKNTSIAYTITQSVAPLVVPYAAAITLDLSLRNNFIVGVLTGNLTLTLINPLPGAGGFIILTQDTVGARLLTLGGTNIKKPGGTAPVLSVAVNAKDVLSYVCDQPNIINLVIQKDFK